MGFIILGIIIMQVLLFIGVRVVARINISNIFIILIVAVILLGFSFGIFIPTGGYKPIEEVQTIELQNLSDQTTFKGNGSVFYVNIHSNSAYTFYTQVESEFAVKNSKAYVSNTISGDNITVVEEENCKKPRLTEYSQDPYITFWSFALGCRKRYYVFYVPKGTIAYEIALNNK